MPPRPALINVMEKACRKAARGLVRDFGEVEQLQVSKKGPSDFVSAADLKAEKILKEELEKARPNFGFLMEESGQTGDAQAAERWIVDPLDGTLNFLHGLPHFAISVALERHGELVAGMIFQPLTDEVYWAERGAGAYCNDRRLRVSARRHLGESVFATGIPFQGHGDHHRFMKELYAIMPKVAGIRRFGAASLDLAYVAAGRYEGFWESGLQPWDMAAGIVLVKEAGGFISDYKGRNTMLTSGEIVCANEKMHGTLLKHLAEAHKS